VVASLPRSKRRDILKSARLLHRCRRRRSGLRFTNTRSSWKSTTSISHPNSAARIARKIYRVRFSHHGRLAHALGLSITVSCLSNRFVGKWARNRSVATLEAGHGIRLAPPGRHCGRPRGAAVIAISTSDEVRRCASTTRNCDVLVNGARVADYNQPSFPNPKSKSAAPIFLATNSDPRDISLVAAWAKTEKEIVVGFREPKLKRRQSNFSEKNLRRRL